MEAGRDLEAPPLLIERVFGFSVGYKSGIYKVCRTVSRVLLLIDVMTYVYYYSDSCLSLRAASPNTYAAHTVCVILSW